MSTGRGYISLSVPARLRKSAAGGCVKPGEGIPVTKQSCADPCVYRKPYTRGTTPVAATCAFPRSSSPRSKRISSGLSQADLNTAIKEFATNARVDPSVIRASIYQQLEEKTARGRPKTRARHYLAESPTFYAQYSGAAVPPAGEMKREGPVAAAAAAVASDTGLSRSEAANVVAQTTAAAAAEAKAEVAAGVPPTQAVILAAQQAATDTAAAVAASGGEIKASTERQIATAVEESLIASSGATLATGSMRKRRQTTTEESTSSPVTKSKTKGSASSRSTRSKTKAAAAAAEAGPLQLGYQPSYDEYFYDNEDYYY